MRLPFVTLTLLATSLLSNALVLPSPEQFLSQQFLALNKEDLKEQVIQLNAIETTGSLPAYEDLPLVDTDDLQNLITLEDLNSTAIDLYHIAELSLGEYGHPTRVIGSKGHWGTIGYVLKQLKKLKHYYTFETQEFKALDGRVLSSNLTLNGEPVEKVKAFQLTPGAHVYGANLFFAANKGCDESDYEGLSAGNTVAVIQRGICPFGDKSSLAGKFGARAALIYDPLSEDLMPGTLGEPTDTTVGTLGITRSLAESLTEESIVDVEINAFVRYITTKNVIAETIHGDHDNVVSLGAHSDSVEAGPGINDDGSGTVSLLTVAKQLSKFKVNNAVRFAWWAAEEEGLLGSNYYANSLSPEENAKVRLFMDYDMMASPNYEYQVYNGSNIDNPKGSEEIKNLYIDWYNKNELPWVLIPFDGRSDYVGFIENGIPGGGIAAGAEGLNSQNGEVLDECYHQLCDDLDNLAWDAFLVNTKLIAHSVATYSKDLSSFPEREVESKVNDVSENKKQSKFLYRGSHLIM
ncbi:hypothetical protein WICPIJ_008145 [Wickerhamomyces pijperi]|uniref:Peptide hydrolase n=1 Tax=Wickerhamomyces pijperi TaxID=599730 RepID=A0A9P8Q0S1_WICPI|nr:hypothetical protein WICPIJ_008145 [Wickerhamomyces pijperi]